MSSVFRRRAELAVKLLALALALVACIVLGLLIWRDRSYEPVGEPVAQPIPFSHKHHVGDDGLDCRYCHTTVETSADAGLPSTDICLTCHSQLYRDQPLLQQLRNSASSGKPVPWRRVHQLPGFVYFNHGVHVARGVACVECHGRIDQMPLTWRVAPLQMQWCLGCHRDPGPHLHSPDQVFNMPPHPAVASEADRRVALARLHDTRRMTDCSTCHR